MKIAHIMRVMVRIVGDVIGMISVIVVKMGRETSYPPSHQSSLSFGWILLSTHAANLSPVSMIASAIGRIGSVLRGVSCMTTLA